MERIRREETNSEADRRAVPKKSVVGEPTDWESKNPEQQKPQYCSSKDGVGD